jgi:Fur family ferric uptake transcriptional regulator
MAEPGTAAPELLERFHRWLRERHYPITGPRDRVAEVVFESEAHLSVDDILRRLREHGERVGTATVYRSLEILVRSGLVRAHDFGEGYKRYEAVPSAAPHGHLICTRCGKVAEFSTERFDRLLPIVADEHDFQHHRHRVEIHGLCRECRQADFGALMRATQRR